ncbi:MAG: DUF4011 domain-containing protein, partial [Planctomycetes bacterium]|nr:DUF4011 domain-containing protein [Planctomycetota bacterium]
MSDTSKTSTAEDGEPNREDADSRRVVIEVECDRRINYAMQQNDVPIVKLLRIKNVGDPIEGLQVRVSLKNGLAEPETFRIDRLGEGQVFTRESVDLRLDSERLSAQTEREATALEVSVSQDTAILDELTRPLEILAYNEWGGVSGVPEILAAFVTPNHPVIAGILARAKGRLEALTGDPTMSGYQVPDRRRTKATVQAIYEAVVAMDLAYLGVPASFEDEGQKVRLPDQIRAFGQGNCLDLSLLLAGALEQAGLHPILVMIKGHAFVAVWVVEESFAEPLIDDAARLLKRIELGEIVAFEATAVTTHPPTAFDAAERNVRSYLADDSRFSFGIDLRAARKMRIRPLPLRAGSVADEPTAADVDEKVARPIPSEFPVLSTGPGPVAAPTADEAPAPPPAPGGRMEIWKRRLLDLSLRNRLLNFKKLRTTFELMVPDIARLEDRLAEGKVFSLMPRPTLAQEGGVRDLEVHRQRTGEDAVEVLLREDLENGRLHAHGDAEALAKDLVEIYRRAKSDIEETGANTLYLALGFLEWYEAESSSLARRAPIILLPITLTRRSVNEGFRLKASGGDARVNVTLLEKLKQEFRVDVSSLLELPEDESGLDVKLILDRVRAAVVNLARWRVRDEAAVGIFAFNKVTMWEDLEANAEKLLENAVVRHLVETPKDPFGNPEDMLPRAEDVDRELSAEDMLCPMDADSSQLAAVIAAARGRTFVLQGPPGTGKSQTITNLIAHAIGNGRRVLFVAEKRAALEVVHGRLSRLGLEPFCLEVHSNKASKREVLDQLAQVRDLAPQSSSDDWDRRATELDRLKGELNDYAERLHRRHAIGLSVFGATSMVVGLKGAPRRKLNIQRFAGVDADRWEVLRRLASRLESAADQVVPIADHPLRAVGRAAWSTRIPGEVDERSTALEAAIGTLEAARDNFADQLGWPLDDRSSGRTLEVAADVAQRLRTTPGPERRLLEVGGWVELRAGLEIVLGELRQRNALRERLLESYDEGLFALDGDEIRHALRAAD